MNNPFKAPAECRPAEYAPGHSIPIDLSVAPDNFFPKKANDSSINTSIAPERVVS